MSPDRIDTPSPSSSVTASQAIHADDGVAGRKPSPTQPPAKLASTAHGVTVATRGGETVETVRNHAFTQMAQEAGLTPAATQEFVARASTLDGGTLNAPAAADTQEAQARSAAQARQSIDRGEVTVAPTQAQAGLLKLLAAHDANENFCPIPSGMGIGSVLPQPRNSFAGEPGRAGVTPEVAQAILQNVAEGKPPFRPELGQDGVSWFTTRGDPYSGTSPDKSVTVPAEIANSSGKPTVQFGEKELLAIYNREMTGATQVAEQQLREKTGKLNGEPLSNTNLREINRNASRLAERSMWTKVADTVHASESGVGKVELKNSVFSRSGDGEFTLTNRAENVRLPKGAAAELVEAIKARAAPAEAGVLEAAEQLAAREKWVGHVQGAFRVGGRVLIVVGVAADAYRIYTATDKVKTSVEVAGGWGGATLAAGAFATWYAPADVAGPWAWAGHAVGTLVAGGAGYFIGSNVARTIYELTVEGKPLEIGL